MQSPIGRLAGALLLVVLPLVAHAQAVQRAPKQDAELLLDAVIPFAEQLLQRHGEFFPFGASMALDGRIAMVAAHEGSGRPPSQALIDALTQRFRTEAIAGRLAATAIAYDARVTPPGESSKVDAVIVRIDHQGDYSVEVVFPYKLGPDRKPAFGKVFAGKGANAIFSK
ncbi:MAG TPA: hypothetical protein VG873_14055 [Burkholderiales bacterium]|nr:hypothetical protein [Burkholderiales bacterium]